MFRLFVDINPLSAQRGKFLTFVCFGGPLLVPIFRPIFEFQSKAQVDFGTPVYV